jgi:DNA-binding MarR family transcriptional regulator
MATKNILDDTRITEFGLLVEATRRLTRLVEASLRENHDLALVEFEAMVRLGRSPDRQMSMSDLAGQMVLTSGGVTRLVDRLSGHGYVTRVGCPSDRRVHWAQLTDKGEATVSEALETHLGDLDEHFFSAMSADERKATMPVLERLRATCSGS